MTSRVMLTLLILSFGYTACLAASSVWTVTFKDEVVYLGGTIHVLRGSDYPLPQEFNVAYARANEVLFETDIARLQQPEVQKSLRERLRYDDGRTLSQVLSKEAYAELEIQAQGMRIALSRFESSRPVAVLLGLLAVRLERLGVLADGVDEHFYAQALLDRKVIGSLESVESQIAVLAAMGEGQESSFVIRSIEELEELQPLLEEAIAAWRVGDEDHLEGSLLARTKRNYPALYHSLIVERNRAWLPKIEALFAKPGREFVLVGVAHLVGDDGLLRQLREGGYSVQRLEYGGMDWDG